MGQKEDKVKILFVCTANQMRSKTAEEIYKNDERFIVRSAGVANFAKVTLDQELLTWADYIIVMEEMHIKWISLSFPILYSNINNKILSLEIPDVFNFMDPELVSLVEQNFEALYLKEIKKELE